MKTRRIDPWAVSLHGAGHGWASVQVDSSAIASVRYDLPRRVLEVEFRGGRAYAYLGVPPRAYAALLAAPSKGTFVNRRIKGRYPFRKA